MGSNYAWSDFDRRNALQGLFVAELPFGRGRKFGGDIPKALDYLIGGWQLSGAMNIASGRPFTVYSGASTFGNVVQSTADCNSCPRSLGVLVQENGTNYWFDAAARSKFSLPLPGSLGNTGRNYFVGPKRFEMAMSISKNIRLTERFNFDLRADAKNVFNIKHFGLPTAIQNSTTFGRIRDGVNSTSRRIQLSGSTSKFGRKRSNRRDFGRGGFFLSGTGNRNRFKGILFYRHIVAATIFCICARH